MLLAMHGEIRAGRWQLFSAVQVLASPRGFVWAATAGRRPLRIRGFDRYSRSTGEMRWRLGGAVPVMSAAGDDITRSAAGRLASELVLVPPSRSTPPCRGMPSTSTTPRPMSASVAPCSSTT